MQPYLWAWLLIAPWVLAAIDLMTTGSGTTVMGRRDPRVDPGYTRGPLGTERDPVVM